MSKQKQIIYGIVASTMSHPTADWIYQEARREMPHISLGTVYRNLKSLCEEGQVVQITSHGPARYDANLARHSHLRCGKCDRLEDIPETETGVSLPSKKIRGYRITECRVEMIGICPSCRKQTTAMKL